MNIKPMAITHEPHIGYLFSRFYHLLGFEKIVSIQTAFPDVIAIRKGEKVRIELEFIASRVLAHYEIEGSRVYQKCGERLEHKNGRWHKIIPSPFKELDMETCSSSWDDENGNLYVKRSLQMARLKRKTLTPCIDMVICWEASEGYKNKLERENIEVMELKSKLAELGVSW